MDQGDNGIARDGDYQQRWCEIFESLRNKLIRVAIRLGCKPDEAEDVVQEVMLRVLKYGVDPGAVISHFRYLKTILERVWTDNWIKNSRLVTVSLDELREKTAAGENHQPWEPSVNPDVEDRIERKRLLRAFNSLTCKEKQVLRLWLQGNTYSEVAELMGVGPSKVNNLRSSAYRKLRSRLCRRPDQ
jgi:RNA polymerase sigma factor (sigma-70 family)